MAYVDVKPRHRESDGSLTGYETIENLESVKNSLKNLFLIRLGEVQGKPWYGNGLFSVLFDPIDQFTTKFIEQHIRNQLEKYEPRVTLSSIEVQNNVEFNRIDVKINYYVTINDNKVFDSILMKDLNTISSARSRNLDI